MATRTLPATIDDDDNEKESFRTIEREREGVRVMTDDSKFGPLDQEEEDEMRE